MLASSLLLTGRPVWAAGLEGGPIRAQDVHGRWHEPLGKAARPATVLIFTTVDCPVANAFAPEIRRICEAYEHRRVAFFLVHVDPDLKAEAARRHAEEFGFKCPVLLDPRRQLVAAAGATMTPEAAVFDAAGRLVYRGRINNLYEDHGVKRQQPTRHDLREALDAVLAGKPVRERSSKVVGCDIPPLKSADKQPAQ